MNTKVISAFPGTGKTFYFNNNLGTGVLDSDSSKFNKADFPNNYITHIKNNIGSQRIIFISTHKEVRKALVKEGIVFSLVYPSVNLIDEYISRYKQRGSSVDFIDLLENKWCEWIAELSNQGGCNHIILESNQFISNIF